MKIFIVTSFTYDIIEVSFADNKPIKGIIKRFDKFIHDKNNDHPFWIYQGKNKFAPEVNTDTLIWWLDNVYFDVGNNVTIISRDNDLSKLDGCKSNNIIYL